MNKSCINVKVQSIIAHSAVQTVRDNKTGLKLGYYIRCKNDTIKR